MVALRLYNNIEVTVDIDSSIVTGIVVVEFLYKGRFNKKFTKYKFVEGDGLDEIESSSDNTKRYKLVLKSTQQSDEWVLSKWVVRVSVLDSEGNATYTTQYQDKFKFVYPVEGSESSTVLHLTAVAPESANK